MWNVASLKRVRTVALALFFLFAATSFAASWKSEGPFFGNVLSIAIDPANPNRLWVSTSGGGVWRSLDGAASWKVSGKELSDRVVPFVMLQPKSNTLWAGVEQGALARSKDGGQTWEWVQNDLAQTPHPVAFDPANPKSIWIPDGNRHKRSNDGGAKWTEFRISGGDVHTFAFHPKDSTTIWAGGFNGRAGLWKSTDGGGSWRQLGKGLDESNNVFKLIVDPRHPDTLYMFSHRGGFKSTDGGENWMPFGASLARAGIQNLTMHPTSPETLYAGTSTGLFKSTDGAQTWDSMSGGLPQYLVQDVAIHPSMPDVVWAGTAGAGIYKTTDGGKSWSESNAGFAASLIEKVWGNASGMIFAQTGRGLFRSDGKGGWIEMLQPFSNEKAALDTVVFDTRNPRTIHVGSGTRYFRSADNGVSWSEVEKPMQDPRPAFDSLVLDAKNPMIVYAAHKYMRNDEPTLFKSTDGGVKWKPAGRGVTGAIFSLRSDSSGALLALGNGGQLWRSIDGATTWTAAGSGLPSKKIEAFVIDPTNPAFVYVASKDGFYRSEDGGATFSMSNKGIEKFELEGAVVDAKGNLYVASGEGVSRSADRGKTWAAFNEGLTNPDVRTLYSAGTRLYAGTAGGGVFSIDLE
jgi:photosystem II stability/assembly factor-like uncharacterized protein